MRVFADTLLKETFDDGQSQTAYGTNHRDVCGFRSGSLSRGGHSSVACGMGLPGSVFWFHACSEPMVAQAQPWILTERMTGIGKPDQKAWDKVFYVGANMIFLAWLVLMLWFDSINCQKGQICVSRENWARICVSETGGNIASQLRTHLASQFLLVHLSSPHTEGRKDAALACKV